jgi:hypothetical protein
MGKPAKAECSGRQPPASPQLLKRDARTDAALGVIIQCGRQSSGASFCTLIQALARIAAVEARSATDELAL